MPIKIDPVTGEVIDIPYQDSTDITAEEGEEITGPTAETPFRFTQHALNPRAEAVSGMAQRDPRARSPYTGRAPTANNPTAGPIGLATKNINVGDDTYSVYDIQAIGRSMGMTEDQIAAVTGAEVEKGFVQRPDEEFGGAGRQDSIYQGGFFGPRGTQSTFTGGASAESAVGQSLTGTGRDFNIPSPDAIQQGLGRDYTQASRVDVGGFDDKQGILRGLSMLNPATEIHAFRDDGDKKVMEDAMALGRLGSYARDPIETQLTREGVTPDQAATSYKDSTAFGKNVLKSGRRKAGGNLMGNIMKSLSLGGIGLVATLMSAGTLGPAVAGALGGSITGGLQGFTSGGGLGDVLKSAAMGGAVGYAGGGISGGFGGAQTVSGGISNAAQQNAARLAANAGRATTGVGYGSAIAGLSSAPQSLGSLGLAPSPQMLAKVMEGAVPGAGQQFATAMGTSAAGAATSGGLGLKQIFNKGKEVYDNPFVQKAKSGIQRGFEETETRENAYNTAVEQMSARSALGSSAQAQGIQSNSVFSRRLPESDFYDPVEDLGSAQGGVI